MELADRAVRALSRRGSGVAAVGARVANGGVGYAMDEHNASLVSAEMQAVVEAASAKIASGELAVHDYMSDDSCPALTF